jgi:hypothetical protein
MSEPHLFSDSLPSKEKIYFDSLKTTLNLIRIPKYTLLYRTGNDKTIQRYEDIYNRSISISNDNTRIDSFYFGTCELAKEYGSVGYKMHNYITLENMYLLDMTNEDNISFLKLRIPGIAHLLNDNFKPNPSDLIKGYRNSVKDNDEKITTEIYKFFYKNYIQLYGWYWSSRTGGQTEICIFNELMYTNMTKIPSLKGNECNKYIDNFDELFTDMITQYKNKLIINGLISSTNGDEFMRYLDMNKQIINRMLYYRYKYELIDIISSIRYPKLSSLPTRIASRIGLLSQLLLK